MKNKYTDYSNVITDIMAFATIPLFFVWGIIYSYGWFGRKFILPLHIVLIFWCVFYVGVCRKNRLSKIYRYILAGVGIIVVSSLVNSYLLWLDDNMPEIDLMIYIYIDIAAFIIATILYICKKEQFEVGMSMLSCLVLGTGIYGYISYFRVVKYYGWLYRPYSIYGNPIPAGHIFLIFLWIPLLPRDSRVSDVVKKMDSIIRLIVYVPFILLTQSRSIWFGLLFTILFFISKNFLTIVQEWKKIPKSLKYIVVISVFLILVVFFPRVCWIIENRFTNIKGQQPYRLRINYIKYTFQQLMNSNFLKILFGNGVATSRMMIANSPYMEEQYNMCDNAYMSILYEWGMVSIITLIITDVSALKLAITNSNNKFCVCCAYVIMASIIPTFFYDVQMWYTVVIPIMLCVPAVLDGITCPTSSFNV